MAIAHVSMTPLDGAAWAAAEAFREAGIESFCIAPDADAAGRASPTDYRLPPMGPAVARLEAADAVICHDAWPLKERWLPAGKPTVVWIHTPGGPVPPTGVPWGVAGRLPPTCHGGRPPLPELVPLGHRFYRPGPKAGDRVRIAACLPNGTSRFPNNPAVEATLAGLAGLGDEADLDIVADLALDRRLDRMRRAHVVIDACPAGSYGRVSLEALAVGCVVINRCDALRAWRLQRMTGGCGHPFEAAAPAGLGKVLRELVGLGPATLATMGRRNRQWIEGAWRPAELIRRNLLPLLDAARAAREIRKDGNETT